MDLVTLSLAKKYTNEQRAEVETELNGKTNQAAMAAAYSSSSTYSLSDICTYLGTRYKCTSAISTPEAWTPAHWTEEPTQTVLDSHASQLAEKANKTDVASDMDNAALWRTVIGNPAVCFPVPKSQMYPKIELVATQTGTGDPSPENIRPFVPSIKVGEKVRIKRTGKNLLTGSLALGYINPAGADLPAPDNVNCSTIVYTGKGNPVTVSFKTSKIISKIAFAYYEKGVFVRRVEVVSANNYLTSIPNQNEDGVRFYIGGTGLVVSDILYPQLELGSTATPYEPYSGADYDLLTAEQDFYGLPDAPVVVDAETNTLKIQDNFRTFNGGAGESWNVSSGSDLYARFWIYDAACATYPNGSCGIFPWSPVQTASATREEVGGHNESPRVYIYILKSRLVGWDSGWTNEQKIYALKTWLSANPVQTQYQLATPITIPITPPVIAALERLKRTEARQNVLTVTANDGTAGIQKQTVTYQKSPIRESDEIAAAIAALA